LGPEILVRALEGLFSGDTDTFSRQLLLQVLVAGNREGLVIAVYDRDPLVAELRLIP
jgi:hypothetical protein